MSKRKQRQRAEDQLNSSKPPLAGGLARADTATRSSIHDLYLQKLHRLRTGVAPTAPPEEPTHSIPIVRPEPTTIPIQVAPTPAAQPQSQSPAPAQVAPVQPAPVVPPQAKFDTIDDLPEVKQSKRQKELIWKEALENQQYYLLKQMEDEDENRQPWFRYIKKETQYGEFIFCTPEMVEECLKYNPDNRNVKPQLVQVYKRDIVSDRWVPSHEAIAFNLSQNMFDGQHRCLAILEAGKGWPIWVVFNVLDEAKFTADSGAKRNQAEKLAMVVDPSLGNRTTGFIKAIMRGTGTRMRYSESEIAEFAFKWQTITNWVGEHLPTMRADVQAAVAKGVIWYGEEKFIPFCERIRNLQFTGDGDPAKALYRFIQAARVKRSNNPMETYKKTLAAIEHLINNTPCNKLYEKDDDIFPWLDGWEVPEGAPAYQKAV
jgi:hypothetical protein